MAAKMMITGTNQSFLRTRMKCQSSRARLTLGMEDKKGRFGVYNVASEQHRTASIG